jgi:histone-lysine N-methyltransferase SETMAR
VKQQIEQRIRDYRRVTIDEIVLTFNMSHDSAYNIVHNDLGYRKVCSRWIPKQLSDDHKRARQTICQEHLDRHAREGDAFIHRIVIGDEPWVYHYESEFKRQLMQWKHSSSPANKIFKTQASAGKVNLTNFWNVNGPILVHFQEKGQTVTNVRYSEMLVKELKPAMRSKRRGLLSKRVLLLHDSARPHTAAHTVDTLSALKFEVLKHPPYRPDLAPSDFHLFGPMKEHLRCRKFVDDNEVMGAVQSLLQATPKSFFLEGIRKLVDRWTKCVVKQGDYVEK